MTRESIENRKLGTEQPFLTADQRAELEARKEAATDWSNPPTFCPHCAGRTLKRIGKWTATADFDPCSVGPVIEYQCHGYCKGRSFWSGS
jgi:hypothetical protein